MPHGICKLCLDHKELQDSHLIPAAVFKSLRVEAKEPISVTAEKVLQTSRQFKAHLLCRDCEGRLSRGGENWVLAHMARQFPHREFSLFDLLTETAIFDSDGGNRIYESTKLPEINTSSLAYFALSMLWKTGIHDWKGIDGYTRRLILGPYEDPIRRFLLGEGPFPSHCFVRVAVWPDTESVLYGTYFLRRHSEQQFGLFSFYIPGITFYIYVGKGVPLELRETCCYSSRRKPILASTEVARQTSLLLLQLARYERPVKTRSAKG
jgi:hypothetical protein